MVGTRVDDRTSYLQRESSNDAEQSMVSGFVQRFAVGVIQQPPSSSLLYQNPKLLQRIFYQHIELLG